MFCKIVKTVFTAIALVGLFITIGTAGASDTLSIGEIACHGAIGVGLFALGAGVWSLADAYDDEV
ncbi:MAG: hypothetical protein LUI01_00275 [Firmicutes bacterium]|nr:hypothetical protein [Bacillota bacterium]